MKYLLGIDSGLTFTKAVLFQIDGNSVAISRQRVKQWHPREHFVERDMNELWSACAEVIRSVIKDSGVDTKDILGISQTAHGDGVYLLDKFDNPLGRGILSLDSRARDIVDVWQSDGTTQKSLKVCGQEPGVSSPAAILAWIKKNEPDRYASIGRVISCKDWIRYKLTGETGTDQTEASTSFTDVKSQKYSKEALEIFDLIELSESMPKVFASTEFAGSITSQIAQETGLKENTPVAAGLHDVCASAMGIGAHTPNTLAIIAGTYSINQIISETPKMNGQWFCRNAVEAGLWNNMAISPASSGNFDWYGTALLNGDDSDLPQLAEKAAHILLSCSGTMLFHPFLYGSPYPHDASASLLGMRGWHDQDDVTAAILEGIIFNHCVHIEHLEKALQYESVYLTGGISRNPTISQYFADALNHVITVPHVDEAACWGAAICAGIAAGVYEDPLEAHNHSQTKVRRYTPDPNRSPIVKDRYKVYKKTVETLEQTWRDLSPLGKKVSAL
ncbi:MAG: FGGY-family carbohydrate kinase [Hyphomicrobiales bacterium]